MREVRLSRANSRTGLREVRLSRAKSRGGLNEVWFLGQTVGEG